MVRDVLSTSMELPAQDSTTVVLSALVVLWAAALCYCDLRWKTLPDSLTLSAGAGAIVVALHNNPLVCWGGLIWAGTYLVVALIMGATSTSSESGPVGGGDIKLAVPLGICVCAAGGVWAVLCAMAVAQLMTLALVLLRYCLVRVAFVSGRLGKLQPVAHGPAMILAALLTAVASTGG